MSEDQDEQLTQWWLDNEWDDAENAGANMRRFRTWFFNEQTGGQNDE